MSQQVTQYGIREKKLNLAGSMLELHFTIQFSYQEIIFARRGLF